MSMMSNLDTQKDAKKRFLELVPPVNKLTEVPTEPRGRKKPQKIIDDGEEEEGKLNNMCNKFSFQKYINIINFAHQFFHEIILFAFPRHYVVNF